MKQLHYQDRQAVYILSILVLFALAYSAVFF